MIQLDLTSDEQETIAAVLENYLSDLRMEIANTDSMDFRDMLKERKRVVQKVLDEVQSGSAGESGID